MTRYDGNPRRVAVLRDRLFAMPNVRRGNLPHLTRETADHESRRLNAGCYETVGEAEAALDSRLAQPAQPNPLVTTTRNGGGSLIGSLVLVGLGAALAWVFLSDDEPEPIDVMPEPRTNPSPQPPTQTTTVVVPPAQTNIAPVPVVVPPPEENPRRRRRRVVRAASTGPGTTPTVTTVTTSTPPGSEVKT